MALVRGVLEPEIIEVQAPGGVPKKPDRNLRAEFMQQVLERGADPKFFADLFIDALHCNDDAELRKFKTKCDIAEKVMKRMDFDLTPKDEGMQKLIEVMLARASKTMGGFGGG